MTYQDVVQLRKLVNLQPSHNHTFSFIQPNKLLIFCLLSKLSSLSSVVLHLSHLRQNKILGQSHLVKSKQAFAQVLQ